MVLGGGVFYARAANVGWPDAPRTSPNDLLGPYSTACPLSSNLARICKARSRICRAIAVIVGRVSICSFQVFEFSFVPEVSLENLLRLLQHFKGLEISKLQLQTRPTFTAIALLSFVFKVKIVGAFKAASVSLITGVPCS